MTSKLRTAPAALAFAVALVACSDLLTEQPKSFLTTSTFFKTESDLKSATVAVYAPMIDFNLFKGWPWLSLELASDQARIDHDEPNLDTSGPDYLFYSAGSRGVTVAWSQLYNMVYRANLVIANAPKVQMSSDSNRAVYVAEAKFLRGFAYLWLTKLYGGVPLLLSIEDHQNPYVARTPVDQVHQQVVKDITDAEAVLPAWWANGGDWGRATKGAAQMALADLYLWRASFLKQSGDWQNAATWAKKVIDSGIWALNADYFSTFLPRSKGNHEMIFYVPASGKDNRSSSNLQLFYFPRDFGLSGGGGWGAAHPTDWHYNSYETGDYRHDAGYRAGGCRWDGYCLAAFKDGPMPWKYRPTDNGQDYNKGDVDIPLYRYAEALLIYAEAENELGNSAAAITYLNMVRARARNGTGTENRPAPANYAGATDQLSVREAIFMERDHELAHEAKRWFDLVRRDSEEPGYWANSLQAHDPNSFVLGPIQDYKKRWPIPQNQIDIDPLLCQNPSYGVHTCSMN